MRTPVDVDALLIELREAKQRLADAPADITRKREVSRLNMKYRYNTMDSEREKHYAREKKRLLKRQTDDTARYEYNQYFKTYMTELRAKRRQEAREARDAERSISVA